MKEVSSHQSSKNTQAGLDIEIKMAKFTALLALAIVATNGEESCF